MKSLSTLVRRSFLALAVMAVGAALMSPGKASAQFLPPPPPPPPPPLKVTTVILKQKVDANTYKVKLKITAEVPGVAKNTFETAWITVKKNQPKPFELNFNVMFRAYGSIKWDGSKITASVTVEAAVGAAKLKRTISASVAAS
jgi:hypothetical protein